MTKPIAKELKEFVDIVAQRFSRKDREGNLNNEDFFVENILPTSDHTKIQKELRKSRISLFLLYTKRYEQRMEVLFPN